LYVVRDVPKNLTRGERTVREIVAHHDARTSYELEEEWRNDGARMAREALFEEFRPEHELDFTRPLPVPEDLLEALDEIEFACNPHGEKEPLRFQNEAQRVAYHNERDRGSRRESGRKGDLTEHQWLMLQVVFGGHCAYCPSRYRIVVEHVRPICAGGRTTFDNIVPACWDCNSEKSINSLEQWKGVEWATAFRQRWAGLLDEIRGV
jgi:5-methylcytosine-specific restriction enzyme A